MASEISLAEVSQGPYGANAAAFQNARKTSMAFADVIQRLEAAIAHMDLWVLGKVDAQDFVRKAGFGIEGTLQILVFHPRYMVRLLEADPAALLAAPLKFAVLELADGTVTVSWADHASAFGRYNNPELAELGDELAILCVSVVTRALAEEADA